MTKSKFPDRLPTEGEVFNGWEISISNGASLMLEGGSIDIDAENLAFARDATAFLCRKNERAIIFACPNKLLDMAKDGNVAALAVFWDNFSFATKHKKTVRRKRA